MHLSKFVFSVIISIVGYNSFLAVCLIKACLFLFFIMKAKMGSLAGNL